MSDFSAAIAGFSRRLDRTRALPVQGRLSRLIGLMLEAEGCRAAVGDRCLLVPREGAVTEAEVVGFAANRLYLMPAGSPQGLDSATRVVPTTHGGITRIGPGLLGRIIDGNGLPLDQLGGLRGCPERRPLAGKTINPLSRTPIVEPLDVGVRAINALLTVGRGQRVGLFAGSGVGKSVLLGMMARHTAADVIVVGLIGERGREVKEFVERILGPEDRRRAVVVAAPADAPPLLRLQGAMLATTIAEYFRDQGKSVLLLMDSLTRYAQAQREIGLAVGEAPATKGYPPSVFARLPQLVERAGNGDQGGGSITAFYTVLTEGDDQQDPIADAARAILDGHIVLSRRIAESGHYPAIDIEASISRVMHDIVPAEHSEAARGVRELLSAYNQSRELINLGAWKSGANALLDRAVSLHPAIQSLLAQGPFDKAGYDHSVQSLLQLMQGES
jgi:flagellum-specific ATP synthase